MTFKPRTEVSFLNAPPGPLLAFSAAFPRPYAQTPRGPHCGIEINRGVIEPLPFRHRAASFREKRRRGNNGPSRSPAWSPPTSSAPGLLAARSTRGGVHLDRSDFNAPRALSADWRRSRRRPLRHTVPCASNASERHRESSASTTSSGRQRPLGDAFQFAGDIARAAERNGPQRSPTRSNFRNFTRRGRLFRQPGGLTSAETGRRTRARKQPQRIMDYDWRQTTSSFSATAIASIRARPARISPTRRPGCSYTSYQTWASPADLRKLNVRPPPQPPANRRWQGDTMDLRANRYGRGRNAAVV